MVASDAQSYWQYLERAGAQLSSETTTRIQTVLEACNWEDPQTSLDWINLGILGLIEAEQAEDLNLREMFLEMALSAFQNGSEHPLGPVYEAMIQALLGESTKATEVCFWYYIKLSESICISSEGSSCGLIYLPRINKYLPGYQAEQLARLLTLEDGRTQALFLVVEVLSRALFVFYNSSGLRLSQLAQQVYSGSASINLRLGLSRLSNYLIEGLLDLYRAHELAPDNPRILQSLVLANCDLKRWESASHWLQKAQEKADKNGPDWRWTTLNLENRFTYIPFEGLLLTVEASLRSIVTRVLLAENDWFEKEMEFWRSQLKPGMVVIDVGANVGIYTFSAATRVGSTGRVLAIEPFSDCVTFLKETCRLNQLDSVKVVAGAASDSCGLIRLALSSASELHQVVDETEQLPEGTKVVKVDSFTLDYLAEQENLSRLDFLKIDAEGHELAVLRGSKKLLKQFAPIILYENIAGTNESNLEVTNFLRSQGYQIYRYQPYLQKLIPIEKAIDMQYCLNLLAISIN